MNIVLVCLSVRTTRLSAHSLVGIAELGQAKVLLDDGNLKGGVTQDGGFTMYAFLPTMSFASC